MNGTTNSARIKRSQSFEFKEIRISFKTSSKPKLPEPFNQISSKSINSGKYYHGTQMVPDLSKVFLKCSYDFKFKGGAQTQRQTILKDPYITKLTPQSQSAATSRIQTSKPESKHRSADRITKTNPNNLTFTQKFRLKHAGGDTQKSRLTLVVYNHNLNNPKCKSIENLKYCYYNIPIQKQFSSQREAELGLFEMCKLLGEHLKIGPFKLYLYSTQGEPINSLFDCNKRCIVASPTKQFNGIATAVMPLIEQLEQIIPKNIEKTESLENHISQKYRSKIMNIADYLQCPNNSLKLNSEEIQSLYQRCKKKSEMKVQDMFQRKFNSIQPINWLQSKYKNQDEYFKDDDQITGTMKQYEHEQIIKKYDVELKQLEKEILQNHNIDADKQNIMIEGKLVKNQHTVYTDNQVFQLDKLIGNHKLPSPKIQVEMTNTKRRKFKFPKQKKSLIQDLQKEQEISLLYTNNIPKLAQQTNFSRKELYQAFIMYKALEAVSSQMQNNYTLGEGVTFDAFRNGIYQVFMQPHELALQMFKKIDYNFSGNLNWSEFLNLMVVIKAKTLLDRVNLFIKIADKDGNGLLCRNEVLELTRVCLQRFLQGDNLLEQLSQYFTKLIFETLNVKETDEIPLEQIRKAIIEGGENSELLTMFCGADL